jgi:PKD repeat protein
LTVTDDNGCTATDDVTVTVHSNPTADAGPDQSICEGGSTTIGGSPTASGGTSPYSYSWSNSASLSCSNCANPTASPSSSTTYTVTVTDNNGCSDLDAMTVSVNDKPTADFTFSGQCEGSGTQFTDQSSGSISSWSWDFDDGNTSTQQNPTHVYSSSGVYNVELIVSTSANCKDTITKAVQVFTEPSADFTATTECETDTTHFTDNSSISSGSITSWFWDFDDGNTSTQQNPDHVYNTSGTFDAKLIVTSDEGCKDTMVKTVTVHPKPDADFSYAKDCDTTLTYFSDLTSISSGSINSWFWDFGDDSTSTLQNPSHLYDTFGYYTVTLQVTSDQGCQDTISQVIQNDSVEVLPPAVSDFDYTEECFNDSTQFIDLNSAFTQRWYWDFDTSKANTSPSDTSDLPNPAHLYAVPDTM